MLRFLILMGYFEVTMYLHLSGKLNQYINLHYSYLAYLSMILSFILAVVQLIIWAKQLTPHSHLTTRSAKITSLGLLTLPLFVALFFPTVSLDASTVSAKGYNFPLAAENDSGTQEQEGTSTQYLRPDTSSFFTKNAYNKELQKSLDRYGHLDQIEVTSENYMEVMEVIYAYPDRFVGKSIRLTGFVYQDPENPKNLFLFRFGIIHCIADSGVFGLLTSGAGQNLTNNTWATAHGRIQLTYHQGLKQSLPTLELDSIQVVEQPQNPYVYRVF